MSKYNSCPECGAGIVTSLIIPATCTEQATYQDTCEQEGCSWPGSSEYKEGNLANHSYTWRVTTKPSCTENGFKVYECTACGYTPNSESIPATGHTWSEWTNDEDNIHQTRTCSACNKEEQRTIPATNERKITCCYYASNIADESSELTDYREEVILILNDEFDPESYIKTITGYEYRGCSETDPFTVTVNKQVNYFYSATQPTPPSTTGYTVTIYYQDEKGNSIQNTTIKENQTYYTITAPNIEGYNYPPTVTIDGSNDSDYVIGKVIELAYNITVVFTYITAGAKATITLKYIGQPNNKELAEKITISADIDSIFNPLDAEYIKTIKDYNYKNASSGQFKVSKDVTIIYTYYQIFKVVSQYLNSKEETLKSPLIEEVEYLQNYTLPKTDFIPDFSHLNYKHPPSIIVDSDETSYGPGSTIKGVSRQINIVYLYKGKSATLICNYVNNLGIDFPTSSKTFATVEVGSTINPRDNKWQIYGVGKTFSSGTGESKKYYKVTGLTNVNPNTTSYEVKADASSMEAGNEFTYTYSVVEGIKVNFKHCNILEKQEGEWGYKLILEAGSYPQKSGAITLYPGDTIDLADYIIERDESEFNYTFVKSNRFDDVSSDTEITVTAIMGDIIYLYSPALTITRLAYDINNPSTPIKRDTSKVVAYNEKINPASYVLNIDGYEYQRSDPTGEQTITQNTTFKYYYKKILQTYTLTISHYLDGTFKEDTSSQVSEGSIIEIKNKQNNYTGYTYWSCNPETITITNEANTVYKANIYYKKIETPSEPEEDDDDEPTKSQTITGWLHNSEGNRFSPNTTIEQLIISADRPGEKLISIGTKTPTSLPVGGLYFKIGG